MSRMYRNIFSVGGWTIASRLTGFFRDMALAALLGGGALNDAYVAAIKLPNQFRQIFGEGSFNAAYLPTYTSVLERKGPAGGEPFRQPSVHAAHSVADRALRPRLSRHAASGRADLARLHQPARQVRPCGRDVADHVPLHRLHRRVRAASGHAQRQQLVERACFRPGRRQCLHDRISRLRRLVSKDLAGRRQHGELGLSRLRARRNSRSPCWTLGGAACSSG